jgi:hypothetical protein
LTEYFVYRSDVSKLHLIFGKTNKNMNSSVLNHKCGVASRLSMVDNLPQLLEITGNRLTLIEQ